jgi:hypothetical protein
MLVFIIVSFVLCYILYCSSSFVFITHGNILSDIAFVCQVLFFVSSDITFEGRLDICAIKQDYRMFYPKCFSLTSAYLRAGI